MKVLFDLNVVSHMHRLNKLDQLVPHGSRVIPHASTTFLEELSGLYNNDSRSYTEILDWYRSHTWGRLIKPWKVLVREETETRKAAVTYSLALEQCHVFFGLFNAMAQGGGAVKTLDKHVRSEKRDNATTLSQASDWIQTQMKQHGDHPTTIKRTWKRFRRRIPELVQGWGEESFGADRDYKELPHLVAFFSCWYVKHFWATTGNRRHRGNDPYDHGYYIECTTLGNLVTSDNNLIETVSLIPGSTINVYNEAKWLDYVRSRGSGGL